MWRVAKFAAFLGAVLAGASPALAVYNANIDVVVSNVLTYDTPQILFQANPMPPQPAGCTGGFAYYFVIDAALPADIRAQLLSRLLIARTNKETVNIGYDSQGNCINGGIRVHRIG
jgi:hypothetical protein